MAERLIALKPTEGRRSTLSWRRVEKSKHQTRTEILEGLGSTIRSVVLSLLDVWLKNFPFLTKKQTSYLTFETFPDTSSWSGGRSRFWSRSKRWCVAFEMTMAWFVDCRTSIRWRCPERPGWARQRRSFVGLSKQTVPRSVVVVQLCVQLHLPSWVMFDFSGTALCLGTKRLFQLSQQISHSCERNGHARQRQVSFDFPFLHQKPNASRIWGQETQGVSKRGSWFTRPREHVRTSLALSICWEDGINAPDILFKRSETFFSPPRVFQAFLKSAWSSASRVSMGEPWVFTPTIYQRCSNSRYLICRPVIWSHQKKALGLKFDPLSRKQ